jgi:hypothetical protein
VFKRQLTEVFFALQFTVSNNGALIATKLKEFVDMALEVVKDIAPEYAALLGLFNFSTTYTQTTVCLRKILLMQLSSVTFPL